MFYNLLGLICKESGGKKYDQRWFTLVKEVTLGYHQVMSLIPLEKQSNPIVMMNIELSLLLREMKKKLSLY